MAQQLFLRWTDEKGVAQERELAAGGELIIGRAPENDVVLASPRVSRVHACVRGNAGGASIEDRGSRNGTFVNDERVSAADLRAGDEIGIGGATLRIEAGGGGTKPQGLAGESATVFLDHDATAVLPPEPQQRAVPLAPPPPREPRTVIVRPAAPSAPEPAPAPAVGGGVVTDEMLRAPVISEAALRAAGVEVELAECVALGGGLGSFVWVDLLRCSGLKPESIRVLGVERNPYARWGRLCQNSQIPLSERIRSNSESCPDNVWGFPGYAVREGFHALGHGHLRQAASCFWAIFGEPAIAQTYTPRLQQVFSTVDEEARRIGWESMLRLGRIRAIRKTEEGRLLAVLSQTDERGRRHVAVAARAMHLAIGYPAIQLLPDLAEYRETYGDREHVVNAYELHDHVYAGLRQRGGTVLLRGRGIVGSRVIQRLSEERRHNPEIRVVQLHRTRLVQGHSYGQGRRRVHEQAEFQPFNWPKACWGGEHLAILERAKPEERKALLDEWGGTTTANRRDWISILDQGAREGWFRHEFGNVTAVEPGADGKIVTRIASSLAGGGSLEIQADYIVDCTGLVAAAGRSPLLADLIDTYGLVMNSAGRLPVSNSYEIEGVRHGDARLYAAGAMTLGGPMAAVDSFLGLQFSALRAVDHMQDMKLTGLRRLNGAYSARQWLKWARGVAP